MFAGYQLRPVGAAVGAAGMGKGASAAPGGTTGPTPVLLLPPA